MPCIVLEHMEFTVQRAYISMQAVPIPRARGEARVTRVAGWQRRSHFEARRAGGMRRVKRSDTIRCEAGTAKLPWNVWCCSKGKSAGEGGRPLASARLGRDKKPSLRPLNRYKLLERERETEKKTEDSADRLDRNCFARGRKLQCNMFAGLKNVNFVPFLLMALPCLASANECQTPCKCPKNPPVCPAGVSLVTDDCGCCKVCAKQVGEVCSQRQPCDHHKDLFCSMEFGFNPSTSSGVCTAREGAPCMMDGAVYKSGETFQNGCKFRCTCMDGSLGCVPVCAPSSRLAGPDCPVPRKVKVPGKCCEEWVCEQPRRDAIFGSALAAYREEATYGPDPSMFRANCLVQTTEWSACSKTCGMGISTRVTNDNSECRLEKQSRLCTVRPCEMNMKETIKRGKRCIRTPKVYRPTKFEFSGCTSVKSYRTKFCGVCTDGRCCTPHRTATLPVEFKCPNGELMKKEMMFIKTCACHYNCPMDNDIFQSLYYRKMIGDMA